jgi:hypothetical protein
VATPRAQNLGTPSLNPPPPGDLRSLADTAQALENYDVLIGGVGFMVYRDHDDNKPTEVYDTEPIDYTYSPVFIERTNVSGDLGDNTQDFYMQFTQRDWSGGIGQKYFRQSDPQQSQYWDGKGVVGSSVPGQVSLGWFASSQNVQGSYGTPNVFNYVLYHRDVSYAGGGLPSGKLVKFEGNGSTTIRYDWSSDGGVTWNSQAISSGYTPADMTDAVVGDDGKIYILEGNTAGTTSIIHRISGPNTGATLAFDNTTKITSGGTPACNCITYWNGNIYVGDSAGRILQVAFGTSGAQTIIKDLGGGRILQLLSTPAGIYAYYVHNDGSYRCYLYNGQNTSEVVRLPRGWRSHWTSERQVTNFNTFSNFCSSIHAMAHQDGVLYVTGMIPARDYKQSGHGQCPMRSALWFYTAGNSGMVWTSENMTRHHLETSAGGGCAALQSGGIAFLDMTDLRVMHYDPATGSVSTVSNVPDNRVTTTAAASNKVSGTINSVATVLTIVSGAPAIDIGDVLTAGGTGEKAIVLSQVPGTGNQFNILRGYQDTTPSNSTFVNNNTITMLNPIFPLGAFAHDADNGVLMSVWNSGAAVLAAGSVNTLTFTTWNPKPGPDYGGSPASGLLITSQYDFNSSLQKYFRSAMWDGDLTQFPNLATETAGTVDLYYKLDGTANATTDTGVVLFQTGAQPGTLYDIRQTARSICILAVLNAPAGSGSKPISQGPIIRRMAVKAAPILPAYRLRHYQVAMFDQMPIKNGTYEPNTPAQLRETLDALITSSIPVAVSDNTMTNVTMVFEPDQCKVREVRPNEYVAYLNLREV